MLPDGVAIALAVGARVRRQLLGPPPHAHGAVPLALPLRAPQHRARWTGWPPAGSTRSTPAFTQAFTILPLFLLGYGGGVFAGRRGVRHPAGDLPARQRAAPVPGAALDRQHARVAPLAPRDRRRGARQELRPAGRRQDLRHRVPAEGPSGRPASASTTRSRRTATSSISPTRSPPKPAPVGRSPDRGESFETCEALRRAGFPEGPAQRDARVGDAAAHERAVALPARSRRSRSPPA